MEWILVKMLTFCTFTQIIKTLLVPTLEITAIGAVAAISTSCGSEKKDQFMLQMLD